MLRIALLIAGILGLVLLVKGLTGRVVGSGLFCKCGYDLHGLEELKTCPECGAELRNPVNVRHGRLARRPVMAGIGASVAGLAVAGFIALTSAIGTGANPYAWQPGWLMVLQTPGDDMGGRMVVAELISRLRSGRLTPAQQAELGDRVRRDLATGPVAPGSPGYGRAVGWVSVYGELWRHGSVSDQQLIDALSRTVSCRVSAARGSEAFGSGQARVRRDIDLLEFALCGPLRAVAASSPAHGCVVHGEFSEKAIGLSAMGNATGDFESGPEHRFTLFASALTGPGPHEIQVTFPTLLGAAGSLPTYLIVTLHVPATDPLTGLPIGKIVIHHRFGTDDPVSDARQRLYQRQHQEWMERLRLEHEARQTQQAAPVPPPR